MRAHRVVGVALVLVLSGCSGGESAAPPPAVATSTPAPTVTPTPTAAPTPSPQLVAWTGAICGGISKLASEQSQARQTAQLVKEPRVASLVAQTYLMAQPAGIRLIAYDFAGVGSAGNAAADRLAAQYKAAVSKVTPKVVALVGDSGLQRGESDLVRLTRQVAALILSVKPAGPDLPALVKSDPMIALAYRQSAACKGLTPIAPPTTPLPAAADGQNYQACADGNCEVLVKKSAKFAVKGKLLTITVVDGAVSVSNREADGGGFTTGLSLDGSSSWGTAGALTSGKLTGLNASAAVVQLTSK
ncbi:hypothetical protein AB0P21_16585 [Kribbella sp. NPDC056861]|uniref:hypothetical protein n=1 Tax=Kribbella sp. NPDC056861 TaxID=3154857 RepID=UPI003436F9E8